MEDSLDFGMISTINNTLVNNPTHNNKNKNHPKTYVQYTQSRSLSMPNSNMHLKCEHKEPEIDSNDTLYYNNNNGLNKSCQSINLPMLCN